MMASCATVLLSGCAASRVDSYCDIASPIYFSGEEVVETLDEDLLRDIITHNETWESICN